MPAGTEQTHTHTHTHRERERERETDREYRHIKRVHIARHVVRGEL